METSGNHGSPNDLLFVCEIAALLDVAASQVRRWMASGDLKSKKLAKHGNRRTAKRRDVLAFDAVRKRRKSGGWPKGVKRVAPRGGKAGAQ